jgi:predicted nuclease of predicted toxin-antitoxin system
VNFIVDQQLPPALTGFLQSQGHAAQHVRDLGLSQALDTTVSAQATAREAVIISKDEDFYFLATLSGSALRLIWVRLGNCRTQALLEVFKTQLPRIIAAFESGSRIVEIR